MATELATRTPKIQLYGQSLPPQQRSKHRAWIGVRVEALLSHYWTSTPSDLVKQQIMADWMAVLEAYTQNEIEAACRAHLAEDGRKPKPADIRARVVAERANAVASQPKPEEPPRPEPVSAERANEIMREVGFRPKQFNKASAPEGE